MKLFWIATSIFFACAEIDVETYPQYDISNTEDEFDEYYYDHAAGHLPVSDQVPKSEYAWKNSSETEPVYMDTYWIPDLISYSHATLNMMPFCVIIVKIQRDGTTIGLSIQTLTALALSELMIFALSVWNALFIAKAVPPTSFFLIDVPCVVLSTILVNIARRTNTKCEDELDTFGLNIVNWVFALVPAFGYLDADTVKTTDHYGRLKPRGMLGHCAENYYYFVLYGIAVGLGAVFLKMRLRAYVGLDIGNMHYLQEALIAYIDAIRGLSMIPQWYMFNSTKKPIVTTYLVILGVFEFLSRCLAMVYWGILSWFLPKYALSMRSYNIFLQAANILLIFYLVYKTCFEGVRIKRIHQFHLP